VLRSRVANPRSGGGGLGRRQRPEIRAGEGPPHRLERIRLKEQIG
jgi:hypothetical protein